MNLNNALLNSKLVLNYYKGILYKSIYIKTMYLRNNSYSCI